MRLATPPKKTKQKNVGRLVLYHFFSYFNFFWFIYLFFCQCPSCHLLNCFFSPGGKESVGLGGKNRICWVTENNKLGWGDCGGEEA